MLDAPSTLEGNSTLSLSLEVQTLNLNMFINQSSSYRCLEIFVPFVVHPVTYETEMVLVYSFIVYGFCG